MPGKFKFFSSLAGALLCFAGFCLSGLTGCANAADEKKSDDAKKATAVKDKQTAGVARPVVTVAAPKSDTKKTHYTGTLPDSVAPPERSTPYPVKYERKSTK